MIETNFNVNNIEISDFHISYKTTLKGYQAQKRRGSFWNCILFYMTHLPFLSLKTTLHFNSLHKWSSCLLNIPKSTNWPNFRFVFKTYILKWSLFGISCKIWTTLTISCNVRNYSCFWIFLLIVDARVVDTGL